MAYSAEVYSAASRIIEERRRLAEREANRKKSDIYARFPDILALDNQLMREMADFTMLMLREQKGLEEVLSSMEGKISEIRSEKARILTANGFDPDYLEPQYTCKKCSDIGRKNGILCSCYKEICRTEAIKELASSSGSSSCSFENFDLSYYIDNGAEDGTNPRRKMHNYYNFCINYANDFSADSPSIVMMGKTGLGKTHLSLAIANTVIDTR